MTPAGRPRSLLASVALLSAAAIAYEILLLRVLSIVHWHHFAWMIISLALLGYGASGTAIAVQRERLERHFRPAFAAAALACSVAMPGCLWLAQRVPFNAEEILWDPLQFLWLAVIYLVFMLPFLCAALGIGLAFTCRSQWIGRIYFADLVGAGVGAGLAVGALVLASPPAAIAGFALLPLAASALVARRAWGPVGTTLRAGWLLALLWLAWAGLPALRPSEFKPLSEALQVVGAHAVAERSGPLASLTVVASPEVPFRHAPGLSLNATALPPPQLAVFADGDAAGVVDAAAGRPQALAYLGDLTAALPYRLLNRPRVLALGSGAGQEVLLALHGGARQVDAVELNPQLANLLSGELASWSGNPWADPRVRLHVAEARGFVARHRGPWDLVQISLSEGSALSPAYPLTVEAMTLYLRRLAPGGLLAITRWEQVPPRDSLKLAATLIEALRRLGVSEPGRGLVAIRGLTTVTLLARNGEFGPRDLEQLRAFTAARSFDTAWYPGMPAGEANRYNRQQRAWLHEGIAALLGADREAYLARYKFDIRPATDDRPWFGDFFTWRALPELLERRARGGAGLVEWGYLVLLATLAQALIVGALLILGPLALVRRRGGVAAPAGAGAYFLLLGCAFLFVEMAFIQKFTLLLAHPLYAVAVALASFLVFAGLGSGASAGLAERVGGWPRAVRFAVTGIVGLALLYLFLLPFLSERVMGLPDPVRILVAVTLTAPLAFLMGMPFPLGLAGLARAAPAFVPWAWGLNGFASVVSAALATLLAVEFGFSAVLLAALALYAAAAVLASKSGFSRPSRAATAPSRR